MTLQITTIVFLAVLLIAYHFATGNLRKVLLLFGSIGFIYVEGGLSGLIAIAAMTLIVWAVGKFFLSKENGDAKGSSIVTALTIAALVLILFGWKYIPYLVSKAGIDISTGMLSLPIPIGLSFYTFQAISYIADIKKGKIKPEDDLINFALYMAFFPKWMSGPIERAGDFIPQLQYQGNIRSLSFHRITHASTYLVWGLFLKLMIADKIAVAVDSVYANVGSAGPVTLLLCAFLYTIQIYCDFAGYTDIAIGISKLFGIDLSKNFRTPYMAENITDFWRRWHISLSSFLRDYVYIPLGGNRKGMLRKSINTLIVFIVCGLWHGTGLSFVVWGLLHGLYSILSGFLSGSSMKFLLKGNLGRIITFILVSFAWIFFRADNITEALIFVRNLNPIANANAMLSGMETVEAQILGLSYVDWGIAAISIISMIVIDALAYIKDSVPPLMLIKGLSDNKRAVVLSVVLSVVLIFGEYGSGAQIREFVYMNF